MWRLLWLALVVVPAVLVVGPIVILAGYCRLPSRFVDLTYRGFAAYVLWGLKVEVRSVQALTPLDRLPSQLVIVCNHESHLDPPALTVALAHRSIRFIGKRQLFKIPIFGWALAATGNVAVARDASGHDLKELQDSTARAKDQDIAFFAEGTRTRDGSLGPFKRGAFAFAISHGRPILPVGIAGTRACLPSHSLAPHAGRVALVIGEPIPVTGLTLDDRAALADQTRAVVAELRDRAAALLGDDRSLA